MIFEDNHLLVVNKRAGILVQGDITGDRPLVDLCKDYIGEKYQKPGTVFLGLVHRIDRPVSGLVVLARTSKALTRMTALFREKQTTKTYWAIVNNRPPDAEGTLEHWLVKDPVRNKTTAHRGEYPGAQHSSLLYRLVEEISGRYLLEVTPMTGRPHQIRVQLGSMGCPIAGDVKYGYPEASPDGSIGLHARQLEFVHPVRKEPMVLRAPLPSTCLWKIFAETEKRYGQLD